MTPGEILTAPGEIILNKDRDPVTVMVANTGDRPIQVGSHYHFAAVNPLLHFKRHVAWGHRLDIPAGTAVRFEPNVPREVDLVPIAGRRVIPGLRPEYAGALDERGPEPTGPEPTEPEPGENA